MKLTRTESGISYVCFRGKCGLRGYTGQPPSRLQQREHKYAKLHIYDHPTKALSTKQVHLLQSKYGLRYQELKANRFKSQENQPRVVMPIFDVVGDTVGYVTKKMAPCYGRKAMTYWHKERPNMHYPRCYKASGPIALVESTLDSIRVARYLRTRALLGAHLSDTCIEQLKKETDEILLALDNDVMPNMVRMANQLRGIFKVQIIRWPADPKDMNDEDVKECLQKYLK